ncbi:tRNA(5-methylaminomethyl-2-thiouridylate)- methyltransferase [Candidatus Uzinura diaspidicola str. ASNER]|uniref:tRNA-specific 2-thiouridylase MnmA n=1 Tax=Candidatus Uzinura diaspidicola str. ASNER TaxID=1133592 RepID=L7VJL3_9FLAO|nr:tRNA(5-methylaminomethyl-2-thiouridylate)- methyltransferase [Candidatus Uzinura diaspidicola str. ASNER]
MKKVIVGISGGVDSSVAAMLLKAQGYKVIGIFLRNWNYPNYRENEKCHWIEDSIDAMLICQQLNIPFHIIDMRIEYKKLVVDYMFKEYSSGRTPNPDVLCNRDIKFNIFLKQSISLEADFIATGHYAICKKKNKRNHIFYQLLEGADKKKDQSYFLCQLNQEQLSKSIFPIGKYSKYQVRKKAEEAGLITSKKKDSQGLCFVGKIRISDFLQTQLRCKLGDIIEISSNDPIYQSPIIPISAKEEGFISIFTNRRKYNFGKVIGQHFGAHLFTKGQRKGIRIGGYTEGLFVLDTDIDNNILYVGIGENHPGLYKNALFIKEEDIHWISEDLALFQGNKLNVKCRIRYRQDLQHAQLQRVIKGLYITFEKPQKTINEGQFAAWYLKEALIGSGIIS